MKQLIVFVFSLYGMVAYSQLPNAEPTNDAWKTIYRATATKINDLVDTKLDVKFDYDKQWMYGKERVTLHPHFYPTDSLKLDAKGMAINEVALVKGTRKMPLKYSYDSSSLFIKLDKLYKRGENYTVYIDYISRPNTLKANGSAAITDNKGLYFINPKGDDKTKPIQIWTQGETESNSAWFPTIDKPNQKTTEQLTMTVPSKYVTLSNGLLTSQKKNADGTRTDTWTMALPHSPYLFFMGVGDYAVIKDSYKGKEVNYYVEKEYASVARTIFGYTPEMIAFYSRITGVEFPWPKYDQITGRDYVSGAMENTTSTLHGEAAQQDARQLKDGNAWERVVAHELFHQWFGDYVTTESWSNITLNESFADYSETLWAAYKHGKDEGDATINENLRTYLSNPLDDQKNLVRFYYKDKEDVFDNVSYPKGGCILHMLRNYVGDSAFFASLKLYLNTYKFSNAEAQQLRLAFEQVTGEDLNWFWNEWYYRSGHPKLNINYTYDEASKVAKVFMRQTQSGQVFTLPFAIDVYESGNKQRHQVWMKNAADTFAFAVNTKPDLVNVDGDKVLLCEKEENKTLPEYVFQYKNAGLYRDRREAIAFALQNGSGAETLNFLKTALSDRSSDLRSLILSSLNLKNDTIKIAFEPLLATIAKTDSVATVRAKAIQLLGDYKKEEYKPLFTTSVTDSSYSVAGSALIALSKIDSVGALKMISRIASQPAKGQLRTALIILADESNYDALSAQFDNLGFGGPKFEMLQPFAQFLSRVKNVGNFKKGVDMITRFGEQAPEAYRSQVQFYLLSVLNGIADKKQSAGENEASDYVKNKIAAKP